MPGHFGSLTQEERIRLKRIKKLEKEEQRRQVWFHRTPSERRASEAAEKAEERRKLRQERLQKRREELKKRGGYPGIILGAGKREFKKVGYGFRRAGRYRIGYVKRKRMRKGKGKKVWKAIRKIKLV